MTDPKFNELPIDAQGDFKDVDESTLTDEQRLERQRRTKLGLSINDTIAANADRSVGSQGVDTSGVTSGQGASGEEFDPDAR